MAHLILHKDGAYNIYSSVVDAVLYDSALTLEELTDVIQQQQGEEGLKVLARHLERAHQTGCSSAVPGMTLERCIVANRAGANESRMPIDEFLARYLTLPAGDTRRRAS